MRCSKLLNVHTVQEAAEMFANASTDSQSPEQLCLLSFLSTSAYHNGRVCSAYSTHTHKHANSPPTHQPPQLPSVVYTFLQRRNHQTKWRNGRNLWRSSPLLQLHWILDTYPHTIKSKSTSYGCKWRIHPNTHFHTHKSATCVCSGWMPKWASMLRQDRSPTGSLSIYVQVSVSFLDWKNISCAYKALNCPVTPVWLDFKLYSLLL